MLVTLITTLAACSPELQDPVLMLQSEESEVFLDRAGEVVSKRPAPLRRAVYSPDGKRLAGTAVEKLVVGPASGVSLRVLDDARRVAIDPAWSAEGERLAYTATVAGRRQVFTIVAGDASAEPQQITRSPRGAWRPAWTGDGLSYLVWKRRDGKALLTDLVLRAGNEERVLLQDTFITSHAWSPDGDRVAVGLAGALKILDRSGAELRSWSFPEVHEDLYAHGAYDLSWHPDGRSLACTVRFLGGRSVNPDGKVDRLLGDREVFLFPLQNEPRWFDPGIPFTRLHWLQKLPG